MKKIPTAISASLLVVLIGPGIAFAQGARPAVPAVPAVPATPADPGEPGVPATPAEPATPATPATPAVSAAQSAANLGALSETIGSLDGELDELLALTEEQLAAATIVFVNVGDSLSPDDLEALYESLDEGALADLQAAIDGIDSLVAALGDVATSDIIAIEVTDEGEIVVYYA